MFNPAKSAQLVRQTAHLRMVITGYLDLCLHTYIGSLAVEVKNAFGEDH